jgi:glycosyltransferase involved in cell wall biosynthesis
VIPHGIPDVPLVDSASAKAQFGVEGRRVLLTFGLIGPGKGIEHVIEALPAIIQKHPEVVYIVLGATHPHLLAHEGERYRLSLEWQAEELGVEVWDEARFAEALKSVPG